MRALVCNNGQIKLEKREKPKIHSTGDAIVKVALSSICTSDLHIIGGLVPRAKNNIILGHEFVGEVVELGDGIKKLSVGDRVSANCETFCGECYFCQRGYINNCVKGGWELGCTIDGCQAEYVRVPFADTGLTKIPDNVSYEDALFVGDILSSGYFGVEMCDVHAGDSLAVIGAGPVGLCSLVCAKVFGVGKRIAIDVDNSRLQLAQSMGLADFVLNPEECDIEKEIKASTSGIGADCVIEAAGGENSFEMAWKVARANANVGIVAMYEKNQVLPLPEMYGKNLTFKTGGVDAVHCKDLLEMISFGRISTKFLITHRFNIDDIILAYDLFQNKRENCLKIAITYD